MKLTSCTRRVALLAAMMLPPPAHASGQPWREPRELHFTSPAARWKLGLPVGNGRLGAMVAGTYPHETIQLNEDSIWAREPLLRHPETTKDRIAAVQRLVDAGKYKQAHDLYEAEVIMGKAPEIGSYQTMGELRIEHLGGAAPNPAGYRRALDLATGRATVTQPLADGSLVTWEVVASAAADCLVIRLSTTSSNGLACAVSLSHPLPEFRGVPRGGDELVFDGQAQYDKGPDRYLGTRFHTVLKAVPDDGTVTDGDAKLEIRGARAVTLVLACATDFNREHPPHPLTDDWRQRAEDTLATAAAKPGHQLIADSMAALASLMQRCDVDLGTTAAARRALPTDERVAAFARDPSDPDFLELYFQFGRYLLASSSRSGALPANLQGLWADKLRNPWQSDYHLNINLQMNYWPVHTTGLAECHEPVFWLLDSLREEGRKMAASYGARGFCTPHALNPWGRAVSNAGRARWAGSLISAPWMVMDVMEHHRFTGDTAFLRKRGWPVLKECCEFVQSWLIRDPRTGKWVARAGCSHEIGFNYRDENGQTLHAEIGPVTAYDQSIIGQILSDTLEAAAVLGMDDDFVRSVRETLIGLEAPRIGTDGAILEWGVEETVISDPRHRHLSHLVGLHPGNRITRRGTPELFAAARQSLVNRGLEGAGWAVAWRAGQYARFHDGDTALKALNLLAARPSPNLFGDDRCQLDQNFGLTAAVAEMLVQSHEGVVELLPALPGNWREGAANGLIARGGFEIGMRWQAGKLVAADILPRTSGPLRLRYGAEERTIATTQGQRIRFAPS